MRPFSLLVFLLSLLTILLAQPAFAQMQLVTGSGDKHTATVNIPDPLTPEAVREMVARMSDDQVRGMLLERLDAIARAKTVTEQPTGLVTRIKSTATALITPPLLALRSLPILFTKQSEALSNFWNSFGATGLLTMFSLIALALALGFAAEKVINRLTRGWQRDDPGEDASSLINTVRFLFRRFVLDVLGLVAFFFVARTVGRVLLDGQQLEFAGPFVLYLVWAPRLAACLTRFVLAPDRSDLRLVNIGDQSAQYLYRNFVGLVLLTGFSSFAIQFNISNGNAMGESFIGYWLSTFVHVYIAVVVWHARDGLVDMMRGTDPDRTSFDETVAKAYPIFAVGVSVVMWMIVNVILGFGHIELLVGMPHYTTMFWLLMIPAIDTVNRGLVRHLLPPMIGEGAVAEIAYFATKRSYIKIGRVLAGLIVVLMIANAWDIDIMNLAAAGVGERFAANFIEFVTMVAFGYVIYEVVSLYVNRRLAKEQTTITTSEDEVAGEGGGAGGSRLTTVLPLVRLTAQGAIVVIFGLVALGALGIDTTPLLAGAGILGLAIGFGAQKLVTDIVSGVFFLIDDAFRVGEYVDVGGTMGSVEKISIRSMQLRHHRGLVHTIPYGEIAKLTNFSRDWVIMKLKFTVPFDTDPNKIKKIFKKIGAEMMVDPIHKDGFLEPFKSQGVFNFDDVGMVIRGKFMAKPGSQFTIRKEVYNRVKKEFDEAGIEFARREVRVAIPGMEDADRLSVEEKTVMGAAAVGAMQSQTSETEVGKK